MYFIPTFFPLLQSSLGEKTIHRLHSNWNANFSSGIYLAFKITVRLIPSIPCWSRGMEMCAYTTRSKCIYSVTRSVLARGHYFCSQTRSSNGVLITFSITSIYYNIEVICNRGYYQYSVLVLGKSGTKGSVLPYFCQKCTESLQLTNNADKGHSCLLQLLH